MTGVIVPLLLAGVVVASFGWLSAHKRPQEKVLAKFSTMVNDRTPGQRHNAWLAAKKIDGTVIKPGKTFSFNQIVGSWSRDQGFVKAPVSFSGQLIPAYGGGVCQTSTTLYNAALMAGLAIIERKRHEFAPTYVTPGLDAAVAYQSVDLRFKNNLTHAITIRASVENGVLSAEIVGAPADFAPRSVLTEVVRSTAPREIVLGPIQHGRRIRTSGKPGFEVLTWRALSNGSELISHDVYPPMHRLVEGSARP